MTDGLTARLQAEEVIVLVQTYCVKENIPLAQFDEVRARFHRKENGVSWTVWLYFAEARNHEVNLFSGIWFTVDDRTGEVRAGLQY